MKCLFRVCIAVSALSVALLLSGCERDIARTQETEIKDDGTVKTTEKTVTQGADGETTITETETTRKPGDPD